MKTFKKEIKEGKLYPYYLLYGNEDYLVRQFKNILIDAIMPMNSELNYLYLSNDSISIDEITGFAETMPFMADYRLIVIENSGTLQSGTKKGASLGKEIAKYLENKDNDTKFIFIESDVDKKSSLYKFLKKNAREVELNTQDESTLYRWIAGLFKNAGISIDSSSTKYLVEIAGTNMNNLKNEIDKLIAYKMNFSDCDNDVSVNDLSSADADVSTQVSTGMVTCADIDEITTREISNQIYDMVRSIAAGDKAKALSLYGDLLALKEDPMHILSLLFIEFKKILIIKSAMSNGLDDAAASAAAGLKSTWMLKNYKPIVAKFQISKLKKNLETLVDLDERGKSGLIDMKMSVEVFICETCK